MGKLASSGRPILNSGQSTWLGPEDSRTEWTVERWIDELKLLEKQYPEAANALKVYTSKLNKVLK